jgi:hypothetical protein
MIPYPDIPKTIIWLYYASPLGYVFKTLIVTQFFCSSTIGKESQFSGNCTTVDITNYETDINYNTTTPEIGDFLYYEFGFDNTTPWRDTLIVGMWCVLCQLGSFIGLIKCRHIVR